MWWIALIFLVLCLAVVGIGWLFLPGISNYAARYYCGAVFVSLRDPKEIQDDLFFTPVSLARCTVDKAKKEVTASVWGLAKRRARYVEGHGIQMLSERKELPAPLSTGLNASTKAPWTEEINPELNEWLRPFTQKKEGLTQAVVVLHRGKMVGEVYAEGIGRETPLHSWSLTKSLMNALTGILVAKGKLSLDQKPTIPAWSKDDRRHLTVRNLLNMDSGFKWKETEKDFMKVSRMLFFEPDVVKYSQSVPLAYPPGEHFAYASCNTNVLSGMIRELFPNDEAYYSFPRTELFDPLGMSQTNIHTDGMGNFVGSSFSMATACDWARFGQLYLNEGRIGETQLLSPEWIAFTRESSTAAAGAYGAHFRLNRSGEYPDVPRDMYYAAGFLGQRVAIFPTQELVVVRLGLAFKSQFDHNGFFRGVLERLKA